MGICMLGGFFVQGKKKVNDSTHGPHIFEAFLRSKKALQSKNINNNTHIRELAELKGNQPGFASKEESMNQVYWKVKARGGGEGMECR